MASLVLGAVGAAIGSQFGLASLGWVIGSSIGNVIGPKKKDEREGPRLNDLRVTASTYGVLIPIGWGTFPCAGNIIDTTGIAETKTTQETSSGGKGGGGTSVTTTTYSYTTNLDVGVCRGPITAIKQIWANEKLVYDISSADPFALAAAYSGGTAGTIHVYLGTEEQGPDPFFDMHHGGGAFIYLNGELVGQSFGVPAYRGMAHVVFKGMPLAEFGNTIPTFRFIVVNAGTLAYPPVEVLVSAFEGSPGAGGQGDEALAPVIDTQDNIIVFAHASGFVQVTGRYGQNTFFKHIAEGYRVTSFAVSQYDPNVFFAGVGKNPTGGVIVVLVIEGGSVVRTINPGIDNLEEIHLASDLYGNRTLCVLVSSTVGSRWYYSVWDQETERPGAVALFDPLTCDEESNYNPNPPNLDAFRYKQMHVGRDGNGFVTFTTQAGDIVLPNNTRHFIWPADGNPVIFPYDIVSPTKNYQSGIWHTDGYIYMWTPNPHYDLDLYTYNAGSGDFTFVRTISIPNTHPGVLFGGHLGVDWDGNLVVWHGYYVTYINDGAILRQEGPFDQSAPNAGVGYADAYLYIARNGLIYAPMSYRLTPYKYLTDGTVYLSEILRDVSEDVGLDPDSDLNHADTDDVVVRGYVIGSLTSARASIEQLQKVYFFDTVESAGKVKFKLRGSDPLVTITSDELGAHRAGEEPPAGPFKVSHANELELPQQVSISFLDHDNLYEPGLQFDERAFTISQHRVTEDIPVVLTNGEAAHVASVNLYSAWQERDQFVEIPTTFKYIYLEPADVVRISDDVATFTVRITSLAIDNTLLRLQAVKDDHGGYSSDSSAFANDAGIPVPQQPSITFTPIEQSVGIFLDIPLLRSIDNHPGFYMAASNLGENQPGAVVFQQTSGGGFLQLALIEGVAVSGFVADALRSGWTPYVMDWGDELRVILNNDETLASTTYAGIINMENLAAVGRPGAWEIIQFQTATQITDKTWVLTGLMRGRLGTEWMMNRHAVGEQFVLLTDYTDIIDVPTPSAATDVTSMYRTVTIGANVTDAAAISFTNGQVRLRPWSPAHAIAVRSGNTWNASWQRRARMFGQWNNGVDAPLLETSEQYRALWFSTVELTLSSISIAADAVFTTSAAHGLSVGDWVFIHGTSGSMIEVDRTVHKVTEIVSTTAFRVGLNSKFFTAYTSGGKLLKNQQETLLASNSDSYAAGSPTLTSVGFAVCQISEAVGDGYFAADLFTQ